MQNLTVGPPTRLILAFTVPLLVGNVFQQIYVFTDAAVVGRLLGLEALAAVGASGSLMFLLIGFSWGASAGLAIPVAKAFGAGDMRGVRRYVAAGAYISAAIAAIVTAVGVIFAKDLLALLNTPAEIIDMSATYLAVTFAGASVTVAFNFLSATIRALGDSKTPLYFLMASSVLNALLVALLVGVFHWGVAGAAGATILAQGAAVAACLALVIRRMPALHLSREDWAAGRRALREPMRTGLPMGFQMSVIAVGALVLQLAVNGLGATAVGAFTASMRVDQLAVAPLNSFGIAMVTFVAQNRGAHQWHRIRVATFRTSMVAVGVALALGAVLVTFSQPIIGLFVGPDQPEVMAMARTFFLVSGGLYPVLALLFVLRNVVQGMGLSTVPTVAGALELVMRALAAIVLVGAFGWVGVAWAAPLAWIGALIPVALAWFRQRGLLLERERTDHATPRPPHEAAEPAAPAPAPALAVAAAPAAAVIDVAAPPADALPTLAGPVPADT
ncbi:MATE efflux family protein [Xylanimonas cellulosilytica DSM 15894]|uniref:Probable multidrug resistance protein NorM n=1 Tax=Xylanimonas cellulosilytica (strain DSM 15894 / JCM 12276 / CECT 5975 / KCTC 9989 / LMG 20990 / NBRC 107835 / XIL07) TaxID=446471 RepID=D1BW01_XYLCX|nr:MATE family efflux transporter [Xylanimonas cellulosilytica]ACZ29504.1 MATE efflux family protein [Xylanimonas cellulosilytica DSM 15894]